MFLFHVIYVRYGTGTKTEIMMVSHIPYFTDTHNISYCNPLHHMVRYRFNIYTYSSIILSFFLNIKCLYWYRTYVRTLFVVMIGTYVCMFVCLYVRMYELKIEMSLLGYHCHSWYRSSIVREICDISFIIVSTKNKQNLQIPYLKKN